MDDDGPIILFDGACGLCHRSVRFVLKRDRDRRFRFAPLQSDPGRHLLERHGLDPESLDTMVLVDGDAALVRSDATLAIVARLPRPWRWLRVLRIVPRPIRDAVYRLVARHRLRLFGTRDACAMPPPDLAERLVGPGSI